MRVHHVLLLASLFVGCADGEPDEEVTQAPPTVQEIHQRVTAGYLHPDKHEVTMAADSSGAITWTRKYDGIDLLTTGKSAPGIGGAWETRFFPELAEPPLVAKERLISLVSAAETLGLVDELGSGVAVARYVYAPVYVEKPNKPVVTNALDVDLFVEQYVLAVEIRNEADGTTTLLDATDATVLSQSSRERSAGENPAVLQVPTYNYNWLSIDVTSIRRSKYVWDYTYKDSVRCSTTYLFNGVTRCTNGQGIAHYEYSGIAPDPRYAITYEDLYVNDDGDGELGFENDIMFGLAQSWDYFASVHGRRGLRNLPASSQFSGNDAIAWISLGWEDVLVNASMDSQTGLMTFKFPRFGPSQQWEEEKLTRLEIIGHEWAHAVWANESRGNEPGDYYFGESGGLDESNSDLFGILIAAFGRTKIGLEADRKLVDWHISGRDMCTPSRDGRSYDSWFPGMHSVYINAHQASGPVNRVHCLIARGLRVFGTSLDEPGLQSVYVREPGFTGIGVDRLEKIWYRTLQKLKQSYPSPVLFVHAREAEIRAAEELYGLFSAESKAVQDAWAAVMVGLPVDRTPPSVTLLTPGPLTSSNMRIEVAATDADGVKSVAFSIDNSPGYVATAAPWIYTPPSVFLEGPHTLRVTATDMMNNAKTFDFPIVLDVAGPATTLVDETRIACADYQSCPEYRMTRRFHVKAADFSGVASIDLVVDGNVVASVAGADNVFVHTFTTAGTHVAWGRATDTLQQVGQSPTTIALIDNLAPVISSATVTENTVQDGRVDWDFCAQDSSPMYLTRMAVDIDSIHTNTSARNSTFGCYQISPRNVPWGTHSYVLHLLDQWGNETTRSGVFYVRRIPPVVTTPLVSVSTSSPGNIAISTKVTADFGTRRISWYLCPWDPVGSICWNLIAITTPNSATDYLTNYGFNISGLSPGQTYSVTVRVLGNNTQTTEQRSSYFTIPNAPPPPPVVYNEIEPNSGGVFNVVPNNVQQIRGTYNPGPINPTFGYREDGDFFRIAVSAGRTLHIRSTFTCANSESGFINAAIVEVGRLDPHNNDAVTEDGYAEARGAIALDVPAWSSSYGGSATVFQIKVSYLFDGYTSCAQPAYTLNVTVN